MRWWDRRQRIRRIPVRCARDRELRYWTLRLAWLAAALLAVALLGQGVGCSFGTVVNKPRWEECEALCEANGGASYVAPPGLKCGDGPDCKCINGAKFSFDASDR